MTSLRTALLAVAFLASPAFVLAGQDPYVVMLQIECRDSPTQPYRRAQARVAVFDQRGRMNTNQVQTADTQGQVFATFGRNPAVGLHVYPFFDGMKVGDRLTPTAEMPVIGKRGKEYRLPPQPVTWTTCKALEAPGVNITIPSDIAEAEAKRNERGSFGFLKGAGTGSWIVAGTVTARWAAAGITGGNVAGGCVPETDGPSPCQPVLLSSTPVTAVARVAPTAGGDLLAKARSRQFRSLGFRYAPTRDVEAALVTNPSATAFDSGWRFALQNEPDFVARDLFDLRSVQGRYASEGGWAVGAGFYRQATDSATSAYEPELVLGQQRLGSQWTRDRAFVAFLGRRLAPTVAASVGVTRQWHSICGCTATAIRETYYNGRDTYDVYAKTAFDTEAVVRSADTSVSAGLTWQATPELRLGVAVNNVAGSRNTIADEEPRDRAVGVGAAWMPERLFHRQLHLGVDVEASAILGVTSSAGASLRTPWYDIEVHSGYLTGPEGGLRRDIRVDERHYLLGPEDGTWEHAANVGINVKGVDYTASRIAGRWRHFMSSTARF